MYTRHDNGDRTAPRTEGYNNDGWGSCGIWVALHDLPDPENGCLIVAVDSHLKGTLPGADYSSDRGTDKQLEDDSPVSFVFFFSSGKRSLDLDRHGGKRAAIRHTYQVHPPTRPRVRTYSINMV